MHTLSFFAEKIFSSCLANREVFTNAWLAYKEIDPEMKNEPELNSDDEMMKQDGKEQQQMASPSTFLSSNHRRALVVQRASGRTVSI